MSVRNYCKGIIKEYGYNPLNGWFDIAINLRVCPKIVNTLILVKHTHSKILKLNQIDIS